MNNSITPLGIKSTVNPNGVYTEQNGKAIWDGEKFCYPVANSVKKGGIRHKETIAKMEALLNGNVGK